MNTLKKYYKKIDPKEFGGKLSMEDHKKKYDNFCDIMIAIDWNKVLYNRAAFISLATQKFNNCRYLEIGCDNNICFGSIPVTNKVGVDPEKGGNVKETSDNFFKNNKKTVRCNFYRWSSHLRTMQKRRYKLS